MVRERAISTGSPVSHPEGGIPSLTTASKYTVVNGMHEEGLMRVIGLTVVAIGWLYVFGGRSRQIVAASVIGRLVFVPAVLMPMAIVGVIPHLLLTFATLDVSLAIGAWVLFFSHVVSALTSPSPIEMSV